LVDKLSISDDQPAVHLDWVQLELDRIAFNGLTRFRRALKFSPNGSILYRGKNLVNFSSNDYLGLSQHPNIIKSACKAIKAFGAGATASPLVSGYTRLHRSFEKELALWEGLDDSIVFPSGYSANLGTITALVHPKDLILSDSLNHASIIDACRLSHCTSRFYRHNNLDHLQELIALNREKYRNLWIVSDSLFSMDGDFALVKQLYDVALKNDAMLILDEAHATGVIGNFARGLTDLLPEGIDWQDRIVKLGTLSKAFGSQGGFVCAKKQIINLIKNKARPYIFSTALSPAAVAAARASLKLISKDKNRTELIQHLSAYLRSKLLELNINIGASESQIIPIIIGDASKTLRLSKNLIKRGFFVPAIRPPSVPKNTSRLRISLNANHNVEVLNDFISNLKLALTET